MVAGATVTGVPLVRERLPGVTMPTPLIKTPERAADAPAVMVAGLAAKLYTAGAAGADTPEDRDEPPQPVIAPRRDAPRKTRMAIRRLSPAWNCFMAPPLMRESPVGARLLRLDTAHASITTQGWMRKTLRAMVCDGKRRRAGGGDNFALDAPNWDAS